MRTENSADTIEKRIRGLEKQSSPQKPVDSSRILQRIEELEAQINYREATPLSSLELDDEIIVGKIRSLQDLQSPEN